MEDHIFEVQPWSRVIKQLHSTVWKSYNFSVTKILREIKIGESKDSTQNTSTLVLKSHFTIC